MARSWSRMRCNSSGTTMSPARSGSKERKSSHGPAFSAAAWIAASRSCWRAARRPASRWRLASALRCSASAESAATVFRRAASRGVGPTGGVVSPRGRTSAWTTSPRRFTRYLISSLRFVTWVLLAWVDTAVVLADGGVQGLTPGQPLDTWGSGGGRDGHARIAVEQAPDLLLELDPGVGVRDLPGVGGARHRQVPEVGRVAGGADAVGPLGQGGEGDGLGAGEPPLPQPLGRLLVGVRDGLALRHADGLLDAPDGGVGVGGEDRGHLLDEAV